jgi:hypothetical protein
MSKTNKVLSQVNSSLIELNGSSFFSGSYVDCSNYESILVNIYSDVGSAACGLKIHFGFHSDGNDDFVDSYTIFGGESKSIASEIKGNYFKISYLNGVTNQTTFRLQTYMTTSNSIRTRVSFNDDAVDSFGKLRTSNIYPLLDIYHLGEQNNLEEDEYISGLGSVTYDTNTSMNTLSVTGVGRAIRQSRQYCTYQPGKSFLVYLTGILNNASNDNTIYSRIGYFDENNGIYFEYNDGVYVVLRTKTSGSVINTRIPQSEWNMDKMDGSGTSGLDIDFSKFLIFSINFSWLGAGIVRCGIFYAGHHYYIHTFRHININTPYITTPNLPTRFEITSTGGSGSMKQTCASVNSEGGYDIKGQIHSIGTTSARSIDNSAETYIIGLRLKSGSHKLIRLQSISLICSTKGVIEYNIYIKKSPGTDIVTDSDWTTITNSHMEYDIDGTAVNKTSAILLYQGYFSDLLNVSTRQLSDKGDPIYLTNGIDIDNNRSDYLFVTAKLINGNNETINVTLNWIEI